MQTAAWYVANTRAGAEKFAQANLERQGFASFCPRFRKTRRHARRVDQVLAPVFPGYIFVRFNPSRDQWRSINGTHGILALVGPSPIAPQAMPATAMDHLFSRCEDGVMQCVLPELASGQVIRLIGGPFADRLAMIEAADGKGRVQVLMDILGGECSFKIDHHHIGFV